MRTEERQPPRLERALASTRRVGDVFLVIVLLKISMKKAQAGSRLISVQNLGCSSSG